MALIPAQSVSVSGTAVSLGAASNDDTAKVQRGAKLVVSNGSVSPVNVTLSAQADAENETPIADTVVAVAAGALAVIPIELALYRNADGEVELAYSATSDVTRGVIV